MTQETAAVIWINAFADRRWFVSDRTAQPYSVQWDSRTVSNGPHTLTVAGYNHANQIIAQYSVVVRVANNSGTPVPTPTATPTPTPTVDPTPTPTVVPTPLPTPTVAPTPTSAPTPSASTFYVSPSGSDSAAGTSGAPWQTIQKAADTLSAGQTAIISAGNYGERVTLSRSGAQASPITLQVTNGALAQLLGFNISGSDWVLSGFDISTQTNGSTGYGVYVTGSASYVTIQNSYIHELCHEGIFMDPTVSHITVLDNRIWRAEMAGVQADGMSVEPYISVAPGFVNYGDSTGGGADFHLRSNSGLKSAGVPLPQVTNDYYGTSRGTTAYSVGAAK